MPPLALWMLTSLIFALIVGIAAACAERALRSIGREARRVWVVALVTSVAWPVLAVIARPVWRDATVGRAAVLPTVLVLPDAVYRLGAVGARIDEILLAGWIVLSGVAIARLVAAWRALARAKRASVARVIDDVPVLVSDSLGPAVVGVACPQIVVPSWLLDFDAPLRALVLLHEQEHCRARDTRLLLGAALASALVPWNPAVWLQATRLRLSLELDCDARVLRGAPAKDGYVKLLVLIAQRQERTMLAPMLASSQSHLERRIIAMRASHSARPGVRFVASTALAAAAIVAACSTPIADAPKRATGQHAATSVDASKAHWEFEVTDPALPRTDNPAPHYPDALRAARVEGAVLVQFVIDRDGTPELDSFKVLKASDPAFAAAVQDVVPQLRFTPARIAGTAVRMIVQQPFIFRLAPPTAP